MAFKKNQTNMTTQNRDLSDHETMLALEATAACQFLIEKLEQLESTSFYVQKVKFVAKNFKETLIAHANGRVWAQTPEGIDTITAMEQLENVVRVFGDLLSVVLALDSVPRDAWQPFWAAMDRQFQAFGIPLQLDEDGELTLRELAPVVAGEGGEQA
ncbi:hypothetical protein [Tellurirhabdus bombi]|uniref:hypothetical protein n=1 Tax=Tellurirhabdus bombi TaxID=2907205 RepID=UPI001F35B605|nr:hypothetical protein [Tellurirhabdus bombi]